MRSHWKFVLPIIVVAALMPAHAAEASILCFGKKPTLPPGTLVGTEGNDVMVGTNGDDVMDGLGGNDKICSLGGNDTVAGGLGNDKIDGGTGVDILVGDLNGSGNLDGSGDDVIKGGSGFADFFPSLKVELIVGDSRSTTGTATGGGDDVLDGGADGAQIVGDSYGVGQATGGGNDLIKRGADQIVGDSWAHGGNVSVTAIGSGSDTISSADVGAARIVGDSRADSSGASSSGLAANLGGLRGEDTITGANGGDVIVGDHDATGTSVGFLGSGDDAINGQGGADSIYGDCAIGLNVITGSSQSPYCDESGPDDGGTDWIKGGAGDDIFLAGYGSDYMNGGADYDKCDGEDGDDTPEACEQIIN